jgi:PDDEXK-like domain of unknown function (DUF3799)
MENKIVKNMNINDYHAHEGLSNTRMKHLLPPSCPYRYWAEYLDPNKPKEEKPSYFAIGQAVHTLVLEPEKFYQDNFVMPKYDRRTNAGKAGYEESTRLAAGKNLIDEKQYEQAISMSQSVLNRIPWLKKVLADKDTAIEESLFWTDEETGILLKSRPDIYTQDFYIDLKTTSNIDPKAYTNSVITYGYHRQAALAREALFQLHKIKYSYFMHIVVEETYPYLTNCYVMDDYFLSKGESDFRQAIRVYRECIDKKEWPDFGADVKQIYLPEWMK